MSTPEHLADWVELEGCFNFRDLGSYHTASGQQMRSGLVYRSDGLQHLSAGDLEKLRSELGLKVVIDLRSPLEVEEIGRERGSGLGHSLISISPRRGVFLEC